MKTEDKFQAVLRGMPEVYRAGHIRRIPLNDLDSIIGFSEDIGYGAHQFGDKSLVYHFDNDPIIVEVLPTIAGRRYRYLMSCRVQEFNNGLALNQERNMWFNFLSLLRTDSSFNSLYPKWANLGSAKRIIENLVAIKEFTIDPDTGNNYFTANIGGHDERFPFLPDPII